MPLLSGLRYLEMSFPLTHDLLHPTLALRKGKSYCFIKDCESCEVIYEEEDLRVLTTKTKKVSEDSRKPLTDLW